MLTSAHYTKIQRQNCSTKKLHNKFIIEQLVDAIWDCVGFKYNLNSVITLHHLLMYFSNFCTIHFDISQNRICHHEWLFLKCNKMLLSQDLNHTFSPPLQWLSFLYTLYECKISMNRIY